MSLAMLVSLERSLTSHIALQARKGLKGEKSTCLMAPTMVDILPDG